MDIGAKRHRTELDDFVRTHTNGHILLSLFKLSQVISREKKLGTCIHRVVGEHIKFECFLIDFYKKIKPLPKMLSTTIFLVQLYWIASFDF